MLGLVPSIHAFGAIQDKSWMVGTRPTMTGVQPPPAAYGGTLP